MIAVRLKSKNVSNVHLLWGEILGKLFILQRNVRKKLSEVAS